MKNIFVAFIIICGIESLAQTLTPRVICSGYGSGQGGGIKLNYTVGETFVTTLRNGNTVLTQGFHQPEIINCDLVLYLSNADTVSLCLGYSITAPYGFQLFSWSTGEQSQTITPSYEGWYSCTVTLQNCEATDSVYIQFLTPITYYADNDGDGYGNFESPTVSCTGAPIGYVSDNTDCDDGNAIAYLNASCDDGNNCTINDQINEECECVGLIVQPDTSLELINACEPIIWNNNIYNQSGDYEVLLTNIYGCDSLAQLSLTIGVPTFSTDSITACDSYDWLDQSYTSSGLFTNVTINESGCPHTSTLLLEIKPTRTPEFNQVGPYCSGTVIPNLPATSLNGISGTWSPEINNLESTSYTFSPSEIDNCATSSYLTITINETPITYVTGVNPSCSITCDGSANVIAVGGITPYSYLWSNNDTTSSIENVCTGTYSVQVTDALGCTSQSWTPVNGDFQISGILVDACGAGVYEGFNELVFIQTGNSFLNLDSLSVLWPNNIFTNWNCGNLELIDYVNSTITNGGLMLPIPNDRIIPANSNIVIFTSNFTNSNFDSFSALNDTVYALFQCAQYSSGHFGNATSQGNRVLSMNWGSNYTETVIYNCQSLATFSGLNPNLASAQNGSTVLYSQGGQATYVNLGCSTTFATQSNQTTLYAAEPVTPVFNLSNSSCNSFSINSLPTVSVNGITGSWSESIINSTSIAYTFTPNGNQCAEIYYHVLEVLPSTIYFQDADGDGFGNYESPLETCTGAPTGYVSNNTDCNDGNELIYLSASCDDNDPCTVNDIILADCTCAGTFADGDGDGTCDANDLCAGPEAGSACDDNDVCTVNDIIQSDCTCAGTFADADNDGTCDANDLCAGPEAGSACDDADACTVNDVIQSDCTCAGTFADVDNDGTCDANDLCAGPEAGTACDDNDVCTVNDVIQSDCTCAGTFADADNDGTCDANDLCAGPEAGTACDDNDVCTVNDIIQSDCTCAGTFADGDGDGTCDANDLCAGPEAGNACDDNDACTINDVIQSDCTCAGTFADGDGDGTCDTNDLCAGPEAGSACDDNDACTINDVIQSDCTCAGTFADGDGDGTCDANDLCAGPEAGAACDDNDPCTVNDVIQSDCTCAGTFADGDGDGTCDANDLCAGPEAGTACDDNDACTINDVIQSDCTCAGTFADGDNDGTCDANDLCAGPEAGTACDDNDACTVNDLIQSDCTCAGTFADGDGDGTCDANDLCEGPEQGGSCDDGDPCTTNDTVQSDCSCRGTIVEPAFSSVSVHACGPYTWNNNTYSQSGTYQVTLQNAAGCDSIAQLVLTIGAPTTSSESATACGSYTWNGTTYSQSGAYTFVSTNASGCPNTATLNLTINTPSVAPTGATASQSTVAAGTQITLTVQGGSLGTGAQWKWYRSTCGGTLLGTGSSITIPVNATDSYFVRAEGTCNTTACASVTVNVLSTACGPQNVTATATTICAGSSTTLTVTGSTGTGGSWRWYKNGCGSGTCIGTGSSITVSPSSNTTYFVRSEGGSCGTTICRSIAIVVNPLPAKPSNITGITSGLCSMQNITYTVSSCTGATSYQWTVPTGVTIVSGQGTASITVNFSGSLGNNSSCGSASICVRAGNSCGWSSYYCKDIQLAPSTPGSISGSSTPCRNQPNVYSISAVAGATSYQWSVPNGYTIQSGQGTTSVTVLPGNTSGSIGVRAVNACGTSTMATRSVRPKSCSNSMPMTFDLWPNPTSERVFFAYDEQIPDLLEIYDMMGRTIYSGSWIGEFDVTSLAGGIYFVRATSGEENVVKRMEVVR